MPLTASAELSEVRVTAPARIHLGFFDPSGTAERRFGGFGLAVDELSIRVRLANACGGPKPEDVSTSRARAVLANLSERLALPLPPVVEVDSNVPEHVGLGSGTQLSLAVAKAFLSMHGREINARELARLTGRGGRSGIGIGVFEDGGLVVDGGHGSRTETPPIVARLPVPPPWRLVLVLDNAARGLHGSGELAAFQALGPCSSAMIDRLSRVVLMRALPAVVEADLPEFGRAVTELQHVVGDYFAPAQGGRFTSPAVAEALNWLAEQGAVGLGQSSWGPTGFCWLASPEQAETLAAHARSHYANEALTFLVATPRRRGAEVRITGLQSGRVA